jgi:four helix bundle protein
MKHNFRNLKVWNFALNFVEAIYLETKTFPKEEVYSRTSQIRRSAVSIPSNIAEGCGRDTKKQLAYFLDVAQGSACELETQLLLAARFGYLSDKKCEELISKLNEVQRMIVGFKKTLT